MARVTGVGGIFLRARDPKALAAWYAEHLGVKLNEYGGAAFSWSDGIAAGPGMTTWNAFPEDTTYFGKHEQQVMINYRVDDLDALLKTLIAVGVEVDPKRENASYGKFAWVTDLEGNRIELWEPLKKA